MNRLNVCFVSEPLFPVTATASRTLSLAKALVRRGHNVHILSLRESPKVPLEEFYGGCHIIRFGKGVYPVRFYRERMDAYISFILKCRMIPFCAKITDVVNTYNIDILHYSNYLPSLVGLTICKFHSNPTVCELQESLSIESYQRHMYTLYIAGKMFEKMACEFANAVTVPTSEYKEYLSKFSPRNSNKVYVVPYGVDINQFTLHPSLPIRARLGLPLDDYLIFFHGSPYPENFKALEILAKIVNELNKRGLKTKALVVGSLEDKAVNTQNMIFTGWLAQKKLVDYLNAADIAVLPIYRQTKGISTRLVEYMALGKATITTEDNAVGVSFAAKEEGIIVANTLKEMVDAAAHLLRDESLRGLMGETARVIVKRYFSLESVGARLESTYKDTL